MTVTSQQEQDRVDKEKIPSAIQALKELKPKELPDVSVKEAIRRMRRYIESALKKNYTYDEISQVLSSLDIQISGSRLKYLLNEVKKNTRTRKKKKTSLLGEDTTEQKEENFTNQEMIDSEMTLNESTNHAIQKSKTSQSTSSKPVKEKKKSPQSEVHSFEPQLYDDDDL